MQLFFVVVVLRTLNKNPDSVVLLSEWKLFASVKIES